MMLLQLVGGFLLTTDPSLAGSAIDIVLSSAVLGLWRRCVVLEDRGRADALLGTSVIASIAEVLRESNQHALATQELLRTMTDVLAAHGPKDFS